MAVNLLKASLQGIKLIKPKCFEDERGFFMETYSLKESGLAFCQDNLSYSKYKGTLRGLHYQAPPFAQGKLISVMKGSVLDVAVDLRKDSPTFGQHETFLLSEKNKEHLYIPEGFAHGFVTLEDETLVFYKVTNFYSKDSEGGIIWNDRDLAIEWPQALSPILSAKDQILPQFSSIESPF